jgi:Na+-transporting methylmalonyl-CoA/oxaloacetate decarboxylase gamma subunit
MLIFLFITFLGAILYYQVRLVKRFSLLEKSQNGQNESSHSPNSAVCAAIIAAINLHKSK